MKTLTLAEITRLTAAERLALIGDLWDSFTDAEVPLTDSQRRELERRLSTFDEDRANAVSWDALKAELASRGA